MIPDIRLRGGTFHSVCVGVGPIEIRLTTHYQGTRAVRTWSTIGFTETRWNPPTITKKEWRDGRISSPSLSLKRWMTRMSWRSFRTLHDPREILWAKSKGELA